MAPGRTLGAGGVQHQCRGVLHQCGTQCRTKMLDWFSLKIDPMEVWDSSPDLPLPFNPLEVQAQLEGA